MTHFEVSFPVRYYETDQMAVVHHSNYIRYFEIARNQMMVDWGFPIERCENEYGVMIPIVSVECRFKLPARMGDVLTAVAECETALSSRRRAVEVLDDLRVAANAFRDYRFIKLDELLPKLCQDNYRIVIALIFKRKIELIE